MKLEDTINLMTSDNWEDRFIAEYKQLCLRMEKLKESIDNPPNVKDINILKALLLKQYDAMDSYRICLEKRASISDINLHH